MGCREIEQVVSALFDGETVDDAQRTEAEAHCASCTGCADFRRSLEMLRDTTPPEAPAGLAERILAAAAAVSREEAPERPEEAGDEPAAAPADVTEKIPWLTRNRLWAMTAVLGTTAALAAFAILAGTGMLGGDAGNEREVQQALTRALGEQGAPPAASRAGGPPGARTAPQASSPAQSPDYVSYNGSVYIAGGRIDPASSQMTTAGTVSTALGGERLQSITVYRPSATASASIVLRYPDGDYYLFQPVTRVFRERSYHLVTGSPISRFGQWPNLPSSFIPPSKDDGSPTFRVEDQLAGVYVPIGGDSSKGIAIPPGRPAADPSGGNPNWTWWVP